MIGVTLFGREWAGSGPSQDPAGAAEPWKHEGKVSEKAFLCSTCKGRISLLVFKDPCSVTESPGGQNFGSLQKFYVSSVN